MEDQEVEAGLAQGQCRARTRLDQGTDKAGAGTGGSRAGWESQESDTM